MACLERYFRNRLKVQILSNYLGVIGSLFFALQNLTTNWGGNFHDDGSLTDSVKANAHAGIAWDEQYLQVGSLLVAWMFYVLGAELQGNLSAGRYKRIMTWMVNVPVIAYMIGNMILSARRVADDVETSEAQGYNIGFGIAFIVLALVCIILYATDPLYADEPWFMLTECTLTDNRSYPRMNDAPKFHNNRFMPQFVLHIAVIICLFYFVFVGFINYGADAGWLLTDEYKAQALAVKVWDIGGASVGMTAVPIILMFLGFEIQGDLPPSNFKPLAVFVGCLNIFCVSIFMYSTTWDACNRGVIISDVLALIIMLILTIWAIACVVCYGVLAPYSDALWLKVLADPLAPMQKPKSMRQVAAVPSKPLEPQWQAKPVVVDAGYRHFDLAWQPLPKVPNHDVEYRVTLEQALDKDTSQTPLQETVVVPGTQPHLHVDRFLGDPIDHRDKFMVTVDHRLLPGTAPGAGNWVVPARRLPTPAQPMASPLPRDWGLHPVQTDAGPHHVAGSWNAVPRMAPADIEYRVNLARRAPDLESGEVRTLNTYTEDVRVPGNQTSLVVKSFAGQQLRPGDELAMEVEFRRLADAQEPRGGWQRRSAMTPLRTTSDGLPEDWKMSPQQTDAGTRHVSAGWPAPPTTTPADIDYLLEFSKDGSAPEHVVLPGEQPTYTFRAFDAKPLEPGDELVVTTSFRHKRDTERPDGGWGHKSDPVVLRTAAAPPQGWRVPITPGASTPTSVAAMWKQPPGCSADAGEYRVDLATTGPGGDESKETLVVPGTQTSINVASVDGTPLGPRQEVAANVSYRHRNDAEYRGGGWGYSSGPTVLSTLKRTPPGDWTVKPHPTDVGENHIVAEWEEVPSLAPAETEYRVTVATADGQSEQYVVAGENTGFMIDEFDGSTLRAGQELLVSVDYRDVEDAESPDGGWKGHSGQVPMRTLDDGVPADWRVKPRLTDAGTRHVSLEWDGPPGLDASDIEYRARTKATTADARPDEVVLPGEQRGLTINSVGGKPLGPDATVLTDVEYRKLSEATARGEGWQRGSGYQAYTTRADVAPGGWRVNPTATATGTNYVAVEWQPPPDANPDDLEYHVEITKPGADEPDVAVLPGNQPNLTLREVNRSPLHPLEQVVLNVSFRYKSDARDEDGGWLLQHASGPTSFRTLKPRPPADWKVRPRATDVGAHHVNVGWAPAPNSKPDDMEYLVRLTNARGEVEEHVVAGDDCTLAIAKFKNQRLKPGDELDVEVLYRDKQDAGKPDGGWGGASDTVQVATVSDNLPADWRVPLRATEVGSRHLGLEWRQPPGTSSADLQYHVTLKGPEDTIESCVMPGDATALRVDQVGGRALQPDDTVRANVEYRHKSDADEDGGGWQRESGEQAFRTYTGLVGWKVQPEVRGATQTSVGLEWEAPPVPQPSDFEYHVTVSDGEHKDTVVTGDTSLEVDSFNGRSLTPGQELHATVDARLKADARNPDGGWGHTSRRLALRTEKPRPPFGWAPRPRTTGVGAHHVDIAWSPAPNMEPEDVEYMVRLTNAQGQVEEHIVPGTSNCELAIAKFHGRSLKPGDELGVEVMYRCTEDAGKPDGGWGGASRGVQVATVSDNLPADWRVPLRATEVGSRHLGLEWQQPPGTASADIEYQVLLTGPRGVTDAVVVPGSSTVMHVDKVGGQALQPGDVVRARVSYRHKSDSSEDGGGWQRESPEQAFRTYPGLREWHVRPQVRNVTQTSAELAWRGPPVEQPEDFEYKVIVFDGEYEDEAVTDGMTLLVDSFNSQALEPGQELKATVEARLKADARDADGGWGHKSRTVAFHTAKPAAPPPGWHTSTQVVDASLCDIVIGWEAPPNTNPGDIEYCLRVAEAGSGDDHDERKHPAEEFILPGTQTQYFLDEFGGEPIIPGDGFNVNVRWRYVRDAGARTGGWQGSSGFREVHTRHMDAPAALLESRVPRIFLLESITFKTNSDVISAGAEAIPEVAHIMLEHSDLTIGVEGHVNFGQKPASADRLSQKRAERVAKVLLQQGVAPERLQPAGHGYSRPRFPRGSKDAKKNRRVEFRVLPGSGLYRRLVSRAERRREAANRSAVARAQPVQPPRGRPGSSRNVARGYSDEVEF